jgi:hypothetical protein
LFGISRNISNDAQYKNDQTTDISPSLENTSTSTFIGTFFMRRSRFNFEKRRR